MRYVSPFSRLPETGSIAFRSLQLGRKHGKAWPSLFLLIHRNKHTHITPLKRCRPVSSASSSWFEMAICSAPWSLKSLLPQALRGLILHLIDNDRNTE